MILSEVLPEIQHWAFDTIMNTMCPNDIFGEYSCCDASMPCKKEECWEREVNDYVKSKLLQR